MTPRERAFIAIGSNIEPAQNVSQCLALLAKIPDSRLVATSSWYRTSPWGLEQQPDFVNLVVELEIRLSPNALLQATQAIERRLDRIRAVKNGPRTIDLDILLIGDRVQSEASLRIPHPGLLIRDFMLIPLIEIAPEVVHPERERPISELIGEIRYRQILGMLTPGDLPID